MKSKAYIKRLKKLRRKAFTLIELMVVISIIGVLSSVVSAGVQKSRVKARIAASQVFEDHFYHALGDIPAGVWNFDEESGSDAFDQSGTGNTLHLNGLASRSTDTYDGKSGKSIYIANPLTSTDYLSFLKPIDSQSNITVSVWIKMTAETNGFKPVVGSANQIGAGFFFMGVFGTNGAQYPNLIIRGDPSESLNILSSKSVPLNEWHHIIYEYNYFTKSAEVYLDGVSVGKGSAPSMGENTVPSAVNIGYGYLNSAWTKFQGNIDNLKIYYKSIKNI